MQARLSLPAFARPAPQRAEAPAWNWRGGGTQFLPVSGTLSDRLLVTYRAPASALAPLVPAPFELDTNDGYGFLSVCAVEIIDMGVLGAPRWLRFDNREFLYRLSVRVNGRPSFVTLRSDVSARALALLGRYFSHYRPELARISLARGGTRLSLRGETPQRSADAQVQVDLERSPARTSLFVSETAAAEFLLGMNFSADSRRGRVRLQSIDHGPWQPRFVATELAQFEFLNALSRRLGVTLEFDSTLYVSQVPHVWRAARWL